jgi:hypothetical protein
MFSWFRKEQPQTETSPGGSVVYRYGGDEFSKTKIGFTDQSTLEFVDAREKAYDRFFGRSPKVCHELLPFIPHVDVYAYERGQGGRDFSTLVTGGMSDLEMTLPPDITGAPQRVELIFYCLDPKEEYLETLRRLAHFPHDNKTWLGFGHTMPNGNPPEPLWGSAVLDSFLFMPTIVRPDSSLSEELILLGQPVHFLWVVPLSTAECNLKLEKGFDAILDLFDEHEHPHVFDPSRKSYV